MSTSNKFKVLITGYEPFGEEKVNPSEIVAKEAALAVGKLENVDVVAAVLPVSFKRARTALNELLKTHKPDIALSLGLWGGISYVTLERVAINVMDARIPDNDGNQPIDEPIEPEGPAAYFTTLPIKSILKKLREEGIPAMISNSAGTFLCNFALYELLHHGATFGYPKRAGYMHIPYLPEQASVKRSWCGTPPSMSLDLIVKAVVTAVKVTIERFHIIEDEKIPP